MNINAERLQGIHKAWKTLGISFREAAVTMGNSFSVVEKVAEDEFCKLPTEGQVAVRLRYGRDLVLWLTERE